MKKLLPLLAIIAAINWSCSSFDANDGSGTTTGNANSAAPNGGGNPYPSTVSGTTGTNAPDSPTTTNPNP